MAAEITATHTKTARTGGRSPLTLARDAAESYLEEDVLLLWEYQRASHGRRQLEWSRGRLDLRTFAGVRDQTDDEIAAEKAGGRDLIALSDDTWSALIRAAAATELLDVAEAGGITAATDWLDERGL